MRTLALIMLLGMLYLNSFSQKKINGIIYSTKTGEAIVAGTVKLIQQNLSIGIDSNGSFSLATHKSFPTDTLLITAMGYQSLKIPLKGFTNGSKIKLEDDIRNLKEVNVAKRKKEVLLGRYSRGMVIHDYTLYMRAKGFEMPQDCHYLKSININRIVERNEDPLTRFHLWIYSKDQKNGGPDKPLHPEPIVVNDKNNSEIIVDISGYQIDIPKYFFIVFEKLLVPYNERYDFYKPINYDGTKSEYHRAQYQVFYEPNLYSERIYGKSSSWRYGINTKKWQKVYFQIPVEVKVF